MRESDRIKTKNKGRKGLANRKTEGEKELHRRAGKTERERNRLIDTEVENVGDRERESERECLSKKNPEKCAI